MNASLALTARLVKHFQLSGLMSTDGMASMSVRLGVFLEGNIQKRTDLGIARNVNVQPAFELDSLLAY